MARASFPERTVDSKQQSFPDMSPKPLWPPARTHNSTVPIERINLSFSGSEELRSGVPAHHELASTLKLRAPLNLIVWGWVTNTDGHKDTKDGVVGVATVSVSRAELWYDPEAEARLQHAVMLEAAAIHMGEAVCA
jgi:hypothetical protein